MLKTLRDFSYGLLPVQYRFSRIYNKNLWGSDERKSGNGSAPNNTKNLREFLTTIILDPEITGIMDIACGGFNWMADIIENGKVRYLIIDIFPSVIKDNRKRYGSERVEFKIANVTKEVPPRADLAIFRDCILHLSFSDGLLALNKIRSSSSPFVLMSTWSGSSKNIDIPLGRFRPIYLCSPPFNLPEPVQISKENEPEKCAGLWATSEWLRIS